MRRRRLGSSGPGISAIGLGAWEAGGGEYGAGPADDEIVAAYQAGFDAGIDWIDTAEVYGPHTSEELVGRAVRGRKDVMVFTKVGPRPLGHGYEPGAIRAAVQDSLRRLRRDVIDLYQLHQPVPGMDVEAAWEAMAGRDSLARLRESRPTAVRPGQPACQRKVYERPQRRKRPPKRRSSKPTDFQAFLALVPPHAVALTAPEHHS